MITEKKIIFILLLAASLIFFSCRKKIDPSWEVSLFTPLATTILGINDMVPDSVLSENTDHSLSLVYQFSLYDFSLDSLVKFPDTLSQNALPPITGATINPGQTFFNFTEQTKLNLSQAEVSTLNLKNGQLVFEVFSSFTEISHINYKIPSATLNGQAFEIDVEIPAASPGNILHFTKTCDVSAYHLNLTGSTGLLSNILANTTVATLDINANPITITDQDTFSFNVRFQNISIDYARGYFGKNEYEFGPDTSKIKVFEMIESGSFDLESVNVNLEIENGFGMDARIIVHRLASLNTQTGIVTDLSSPFIGQTLNISRAAETFNPLAPVTPSKYTYNLNNSNVAQLIENIPDKLIYQLDVTTNPLGNVSAGNDFIYYGNYLNAIVNMEIPLSLIASNLVLSQEVDLNLGQHSGNPGQAMLKLIADNGFPLNADLQIYLLDQNLQISDSLLSPAFLYAPALDASLKVIAPQRTEYYIPMSEYRLNKLFASKKLIFRAKFNTLPAGSHVKIYEHYKLDLKLCSDFNYLIRP